MDKFLRRIEIALGSAFLLGICLSGVLCRHVFWFDLAANLRVQVAIALTVSFVYVLVRRKKVAAYFIGLAWLMTVSPIVWAAFLVASPGHPANAGLDNAGVAVEGSVTLTTLNVLRHNTHYEAVMNHLQAIDPDLFAILELNTNWDKKIRSRFSTTHSYVIAQPTDSGNFGIGLYSKIPFRKSNIASWGNLVPSLDVTLVSPNIRVIATHPMSPMSGRNFDHRNRQLDEIAVAVADSGSGVPTIVMGDFNLTPWSPLFRDFVDTSGLLPVRSPLSISPTWYGGPSHLPFGLVLDHVCVSNDIQPVSMSIGENVGSDHRSVTVRCRPKTEENIR